MNFFIMKWPKLSKKKRKQKLIGKIFDIFDTLPQEDTIFGIL